MDSIVRLLADIADTNQQAAGLLVLLA